LAGINDPMSQPTSTTGTDDLSSAVWTMDDVTAFLRITPAQVRRLMGVDQTFPVPAQISPRVWRWERAAVQEWLRSGSATRPRSVTSEPRSIVERV
jgi:predicted DNA-binding transcriptional regulator AlpA